MTGERAAEALETYYSVEEEVESCYMTNCIHGATEGELLAEIERLQAEIHAANMAMAGCLRRLGKLRTV